MSEEAERAEEIRVQQRRQWKAGSRGWHRHRERLHKASAPLTEALIEMARVQAGQSVLDLSSGTGDPAFDIAARVGSQGYVLGVDLSYDMLDGARDWAISHDIRNVEFQEIESETEVPVPDGTFDAATCRNGLMFMPFPKEACAQVHRALKPGGWFAASTFSGIERRPRSRLLREIIDRHAGESWREAEASEGHNWGTEEALKNVLRASGFNDVEVREVEWVMVDGLPPAAYWEFESEVFTPLADFLETLSEEDREAVREDAINTLTAMFPDGNVRFTTESLVGAGRKP